MSIDTLRLIPSCNAACIAYPNQSLSPYLTRAALFVPVNSQNQLFTINLLFKKVLHSKFVDIVPGNLYEHEYNEFSGCLGEPMMRLLVDLKYA